MRRQVFPQAPSPTMTSFLRISDMDINGLSVDDGGQVRKGMLACGCVQLPSNRLPANFKRRFNLLCCYVLFVRYDYIIT